MFVCPLPMTLRDNAGRLRRQSSLQHSDTQQQQQWHIHTHILKKDSFSSTNTKVFKLFLKISNCEFLCVLTAIGFVEWSGIGKKMIFFYFSSVKLCLISVLKGKTHNQNISLFLFLISSKPKQRKKNQISCNCKFFL